MPDALAPRSTMQGCVISAYLAHRAMKFGLSSTPSKFIVILNHQRLLEFTSLSNVQCSQVADPSVLHACIKVRLLIFRGFFYDPQGILAAVHRFAGMTIELLLDTDLSFREILKLARVCRELCIASVTHSENRNFFTSFYDPEFALRHDCSLAHLARRA